MRGRAKVGNGRIAGGVIGMLTEQEREGWSDGSELTNFQWSQMHTLWLEALRANMPVIEMVDREFRIRFEVVRRVPSLSVHAIRPELAAALVLHNPVKFIRLRVDSTDGRLTYAERIEPYVSDRATVQAMFLSLQSVIGRIPPGPKSLLAHP